MAATILTVISTAFILAVGCFSLAAPCTDKIYVGSPSDDIAISLDAGEHWPTKLPQLLGGGGYPRDPYIYSIFAQGNDVYVGAEKGFRVSRDGGKSWKRTGLGSNRGVEFTHSVFAINDRVYASSSEYISDRKGQYFVNRFLISNDKGETWPVNITFDHSVGAIYVSKSKIYFGTEQKGLAISEDDGKTWKYVGKSEGLASDKVTAIAGVDDKIYVGSHESGGKISISEDGGKTWRIEATSKSAYNGINGIAVAEDGMIYVTGAPGGLSISSDGGKTWVNKGKTEGLGNENASKVAVIGNNVYVGSYGAYLSVSRDGGNTWTTKGAKDGLKLYDISAIFAQCI